MSKATSKRTERVARYFRLALTSVVCASTALGVTGCVTTTGDPYEDSFFFSQVKFNERLAALRSELAYLDQALSSRKTEIADLRARAKRSGRATPEVMKDIERLHADILAKEAAVAKLERESSGASFASYDSAEAKVSSLKSDIKDIDQTMSLIDARLK